MKKKSFVSTLVLLIIYNGALAQNNHINTVDSLSYIIFTKLDSNRVKAELTLATQTKNIDTAIAFAQSGYKHAIKINFKSYYAKSLRVIGNLYQKQQVLDSAEYYYQKAIAAAKEFNDTLGEAVCRYELVKMLVNRRSNYNKALSQCKISLQLVTQLKDSIRMATISKALGTIYYLQQDYLFATKYVLIALSLSEKIGYKSEILRAYGSLVESAKSLKDYPKGLYYLNEILKIETSSNDTNSIRDTKLAIADIFLLQKKYKEALKIYTDNYEASVKESSISEMYTANSLANTYSLLDQQEMAIKFMLRAIEIAENEKIVNEKYVMQASLGAFYFKQAQNANVSKTDSDKGAQINTAIKWLKMAVDSLKAEKDFENVHEFLSYLTEAYTLQGNTAAALLSYKQEIFYRDSLLNIDQKDSVRHMILSYEFTKKTDSVNAEKQLQRLQSEKQTALAALAFEYDKKQMLAKTTTEKLQLQQEEALKRAGIENEYNLKAATLLALQKTKELEASMAAQQNAAELKNKNKNQKLIGIGIITAFSFAGLWFYMYNRSKQRKLKNQLALQEANQKLKDAEYATKLNNVTFDALRSQMNPHFIFNCLNSIKLYTEQNNKQVASTYLDKFSSLIRSVLDNARTEHVTLNSEIQSLRLYLDLESMRFKDKLSYKINVSNNVDAEYIEIPPMLIQPYVENAIWHGLMNKPEGGTITLDFAQENDVLHATVTDNGIGRTHAAAIKASSGRTHKSLGTQITHERITLINKRYNTNANVVLTDVLDSSNNPAGTRATIQIPVI